MADESPTGAWSSIVPEFYYDLISRIPPGILLTLLLSHEFGLLSDKSIDKLLLASTGFLAILAIFLVGAGYSLGLFITVLGGQIRWLFFMRDWRRLDAFQKRVLDRAKDIHPFDALCLKDFDQFGRKEHYYLFRTMHDFLKANDPQAKTLLPKMSAETSLFSNTVASLLLWSTTHVIHRIYLGLPLRWVVLLPVILISCLLVWMGTKRAERLISGQYSYLNMVISSGSGGE